MIYGAIDEKSEMWYTHLKKLFEAIDNKQLEYNWLITDWECNTDTVGTLYDEYCWLSGEELTDLVVKKDPQWIWAVLSGFDKSVTAEEVLKHKLPFANGYGGFWKKPLSLQNPLAKIEIVAWDSYLVLILSERKEIVDSFRKHYPKSKDLIDYIDEP